jgi:hypothetical protein
MVKQMLHAASSPDQAPSNFFFFGHLTKACQIEDPVPGKPQMRDPPIFVEIGQAMRTTAFEIRITRAKWVVEHKGEYFHN